MTRCFDFVFSLIGFLLLLPVFIVLYCIGLIDTGSPLFIQTRVGKDQKPFSLIKFRTMRKDTESVGTHLVSKDSVTKYGAFLRKTKLDELPQLINVIKGDMSLVGARPNLYNQTELIEARAKLKVYDFRPGITGLSQINEIDMSTPQELAATDAEMYTSLSTINYFYYIFATLSGKGQGDRISEQ